LFEVSPRHAARLAFDLRKRGLLSEFKRGVYASVPLELDPKVFRPDPYLAVSKALGKEYAFSHTSALTLLGSEQTVRKTIHVSAPGARARRKRMGGFEVLVHSVPERGWTESTTEVRRGGGRVRVTTPERTLVDLVARPSSVQEYEEDRDAFRRMLPRVEPKGLLGALHAARRRAAWSRVGHLLRESGLEQSPSPELAKLLVRLEKSVMEANPTYFGTRPHVPSNRFDHQFKIVYPGGS
jgi:predicted transcriptional regulator of viral defense system